MFLIFVISREKLCMRSYDSDFAGKKTLWLHCWEADIAYPFPTTSWVGAWNTHMPASKVRKTRLSYKHLCMQGYPTYRPFVTMGHVI